MKNILFTTEHSNCAQYSQSVGYYTTLHNNYLQWRK